MALQASDGLAELRARIGAVQHAVPCSPPIRFGLDSIDGRLRGGGLRAGALHEMLGQGADTEHATLPSLLVAGLLARHESERPVFWAMARDDLFAPALAGAGLHPRRLILAEAGRSMLSVMEEALRHPGLLAVVGEIDGALGLTASRRLQLAAEASGVTCFALRRSRRFDDPALLAPSAALTRWRIAAQPSPSEGGWMADASRWRIELLRARDSAPFHLTVQARDGVFDLADLSPLRRPVAAVLADGPVARRAG